MVAVDETAALVLAEDFAVDVPGTDKKATEHERKRDDQPANEDIAQKPIPRPLALVIVIFVHRDRLERFEEGHVVGIVAVIDNLFGFHTFPSLFSLVENPVKTGSFRKRRGARGGNRGI